MKVNEKKWIRVRIYIVASFFICGMVIIVLRAYQLQVLEQDKLGAIASAGYKGKIRLPPKRGTIYDRDGHELAVSVEVGSIYAHPGLIKKKSDTARHLSKLLQMSEGETLQLLNSKRPFVWIKRQLPPSLVERVRDLKIEGIGDAAESRRFYPGREIAGHLIGFAGDDNQGLEGLERTYDRMLRGPQHTLIQMRDALGRPFYISRPADSEMETHDLVLTIDKDIQYRAQQSLQAVVEKFEAKSGQCVIVDSRTGEILAMAVAPQFNPNIFRKYKPEQWRNRIISDCYEPGSTIKAFLLAAALEKGAVSPQTRLDCEQGNFQFAGHTIHDTKEHGTLSVSDIVVLSSNIGAVKIGQRLGYKTFTDYLKSFGFGTKSGIDLVGEREGFIREIEAARGVDKATIFFGQGMASSSIQLAMAMAAIANDGKLMRPYVVKAIKDPRGRTVKRTYPKMIRSVLRPEIARKVSTILEGVVSEKGTAPLAAISGYRAAGKTGTSQKVDPRTGRYSQRNYVAIFVGFVPVHNPKLVILVTVDEPRGKQYGGLVAAPVFSEVGSWALNHLRINPQIKMANFEQKVSERIRVSVSGTIAGTEGTAASETRLPDFSGCTMREVLKEGTALGLKVLLEGTGFAVGQAPGPGAALDEVTTVKVTFKPPM